MDHIKPQHLVTGATEEYPRVKEDFEVLGILNEMNSHTDEESDREKDASAHVMSTYHDNKPSRMAGSQKVKDASLNELRSPRGKEDRGRLRADKSRATKRPGAYQRRLRHKHIKARTRLNNQMKEAETAFAKSKTEASTQTELPIAKPTANLGGRHSIVESLTRFLDEAESRRESNWKRFMTEMECLNEAVRQEIKMCRSDIVRGLLDKDVVQRSEVEQEEHMRLWGDSCLYCTHDGCSGCSGD